MGLGLKEAVLGLSLAITPTACDKDSEDAIIVYTTEAFCDSIATNRAEMVAQNFPSVEVDKARVIAHEAIKYSCLVDHGKQ